MEQLESSNYVKGCVSRDNRGNYRDRRQIHSTPYLAYLSKKYKRKNNMLRAIVVATHKMLVKSEILRDRMRLNRTV